ncbi:NADH dehydrogenase [ubiquinone] 1 alpha subcomplex subunit 3 [Bagarius yarrelli]|uniref:NADH dehydrogenase [ubiquinone] 1 alpha subcomplex subunit 3 n=1 Tax=Bagarius yarrelli TaxID=175774 RepID=A0A556U1I0_BAGYA|nr:NADH dehydrogenase [ubiquinone] 1 alpha subcomplex subunit 3 [Bagarius yarrelli]
MHAIPPPKQVDRWTEKRSMFGVYDNIGILVGKFLKNAWNKEPVLTTACGLGIAALILPLVSPYTKYTAMLNQATPYNYPGEGFSHCKAPPGG